MAGTWAGSGRLWIAAAIGSSAAAIYRAVVCLWVYIWCACGAVALREAREESGMRCYEYRDGSSPTGLRCQWTPSPAVLAWRGSCGAAVVLQATGALSLRAARSISKDGSSYRTLC